MECSACGESIISWHDHEGNEFCDICFNNLDACEICGVLADNRQPIINKLACDSCFTKIDKVRSDPRIKKLLSFKLSELKSNLTNTQDDFELLGNEALSSALNIKNYEIIGIHPNASLNQIKDKCKELMQTSHPDLHKHDQEKYNQAIEKVSKLKKAYEAIVAEKNEPYLLLELKYGASQKEIVQAYENLKGIYNPSYFTDNVTLQEKVKYKRDEITKTFEHLMMLMQQGNNTSPIQKQSSLRQQPITSPTQLNPIQPNSNSTIPNTAPLNINPPQTPRIRMDKSKGKKWALNVLWMVVAFNGFKVLFGLASANPSETAGMAIVSMIGGVVILCPIAFTIGYFQKNVS